ncbi:MAG TPA: hypothetical protein VGI35_07555 [Steroidobacteraceae bacterium]
MSKSSGTTKTMKAAVVRALGQPLSIEECRTDALRRNAIDPLEEVPNGCESRRSR